jgi:SAM-dependent methyltransferase
VSTTKKWAKFVQAWKASHMVKGALTWVPPFNAWRIRRASTGGSDSPRYCYSAWLRHLVLLSNYGFKISNACVGELGPGDSIGIGLAALLSGAAQYVGLDIVPFSANANLQALFDKLVHLYWDQESIPNNDEFPRLRPELDSYTFPSHLIDVSQYSVRAEKLRGALRGVLGNDSNTANQMIMYKAPWASPEDITPASLDLIFSQAVLEHVDDLDGTYEAMFAWLKPGGYASHVIDFSAHQLSPFWNGHWAYSDWQWRLTRGRREFLLNREPLSRHLSCAQRVGLEIVAAESVLVDDNLDQKYLSKRFQKLGSEDAHTCGVWLVLMKP